MPAHRARAPALSMWAAWQAARSPLISLCAHARGSERRPGLSCSAAPCSGGLPGSNGLTALPTATGRRRKERHVRPSLMQPAHGVFRRRARQLAPPRSFADIHRARTRRRSGMLVWQLDRSSSDSYVACVLRVISAPSSPASSYDSSARSIEFHRPSIERRTGCVAKTAMHALADDGLRLFAVRVVREFRTKWVFACRGHRSGYNARIERLPSDRGLRQSLVESHQHIAHRVNTRRFCRRPRIRWGLSARKCRSGAQLPGDGGGAPPCAPHRATRDCRPAIYRRVVPGHG